MAYFPADRGPFVRFFWFYFFKSHAVIVRSTSTMEKCQCDACGGATDEKQNRTKKRKTVADEGEGLRDVRACEFLMSRRSPSDSRRLFCSAAGAIFFATASSRRVKPARAWAVNT